jgi:two-component system, NtrC family, sensor kinase
LLIMPIVSFAQFDQVYIDSLQTVLNNAANDTIRLEINRQLGFYYQDSDPGTALIYHQEQLRLSKKLNLKLWEADAYQQVGYCYRGLENLPASYESYMEGLKIAEDPSSSENGWGYHNFSFSSSPDDARQSIVGMIHFELGTLYQRTRSYDEVLTQLFQALSIGEKLKNKKILSLSTRDIGVAYFQRDQPDSAFKYYKKALYHYEDSPYQINKGALHLFISEYYAKAQKIDSAMVSAKTAMSLSVEDTNLGSLARSQLFLGSLFLQKSQLDSALIYTQKAVETSQWINDKRGEGDAYVQLASIYRLQEQNGSAYEYLYRGEALLDSLDGAYITRLLQFQNIEFDQKIRLQELEKENELTKNRIRVYSLLAGLVIFLLIALLLYRNNRQKQKANKVLEATLANLKTTQAQLIQSEKMASLGELTAGIAHEIQNPLNFVNNFSEVSNELIDEMNGELDKGDIDEAKAISADIKQNLEKINHHGKRADAIVKGMLAHSRSSSGEKVLTDINALADEYLRLSYHGLRAKDKNFNAEFKTDFDSELPKINVIPQDIGRVLLNLINNAFQACTEPSRSATAEVEKPLVQVSTRKSDNGIEIRVSDNGPGIPDSIKDKIFQPFFTTKPTGQGTGLGLSLSYDIVKAHGGELKVETKEESGLIAGEAGTEFTIELPI